MQTIAVKARVEGGLARDGFGSRRSASRQESPAKKTPVHAILHLQAAMGNLAVQRLLRAHTIQPKLTIGQPGDRYEQEADRVAEHVLRLPEPSAPHATETEGQPPVIQRLCTSCEEEEIRRQLNREEDNRETLDGGHTRPDQQASVAGDFETRLGSLRGGGRPLSPQDRAFFERRFGRDFGQVRVHTDAGAAELARSIDARAFTAGRDIAFGAGEYASGTTVGKTLLAHELTHVVQQNRGGVQRKCRHCEAATERNDAPLVPSTLSTGGQNDVQRVHLENGRKKFDCSDLAGDTKLEACLNDEDRLRPFDTGASVARIQRGLQKDGQELGADGTSGVYGADTGRAVMAFKQKHALGSTQFPDVGPGTTKKLDELCVGTPKPKTPVLPKPKPPQPERPGACGPGTANPFCLPIPAIDAPCKPFPSANQAEAVRDDLSATIPLLTATATRCGEVKPVWETYFAATSKPFSFSATSSCVVAAAKSDPDGSDLANRAAKGHLEDIKDNLPVTLRGVSPSFFPLGGPIAVRRLPLEDAIGPHGPFFLHPPIVYNDPFNAAANLAGAVGVSGEGSDIFGDDDRVIGGTVVIEVDSIDPASGRLTGEVRWQPHIHVKDTVDFCPGNLGNAEQRRFTVPMSKLEAMGLTRDVPITIDYDLEVQRSRFSVLPAIGPPRP